MKRCLTATAAKHIKASGFYRADVSLYLKVTQAGGKFWIQRLVINGKRKDIGLGGYPVVSFDDAKVEALENRQRLREGIDPLAEKNKTRTPTFREAAEKTFQTNKTHWRSEKTVANWTRGMDRYAFPVIGDMRVDQVGREQVLRILNGIWKDKPEAARKLRQRIRTVFSWCHAHGFIEHNPAGEMIDGGLQRMPAVKSNYRSLPYKEVAGALETVEATDASLAVKLCFRFLVLTAARSGEARGATWAEIDLSEKEWRIPANRMKSHNEHRVPLSDAALVVLEQAMALRDDSNLVFPSPQKPGTQLSDMTLTKILRTTGLADKATIHGFRASLKSWAMDTGKPREVCELALAHKIPGVEGAYFRSDLYERRKLLMAQWADYLTATDANIMRFPYAK